MNKLSFTNAALAAALIFFAFFASAQTNTVLNQGGADDKTKFEWWCYHYDTQTDEFLETFYEDIPKTVYIISKSVDYYIKYNEHVWGEDYGAYVIPFSDENGKFTNIGSSFFIENDAKVGYYDVSIEDVGNDQWSVSILKTVPQMDEILDQEYTGNAITPEPLVVAGSLELTKGTDYEYSYTDNTNCGTATVRVTFKGDYAS